MKNLLPLLFVAVMATVFTSCKPKQTCYCTYKDTAGSTLNTKNEIIGSSKDQAKKQCETFQGLLGSQGYKSVSCAIQ